MTTVLARLRSPLLLAVLAALLLAGCKADARLDVVVHDDGSGTVTLRVVLDQEAVDALGGVADQIAVGDIQASGWDVRGGPDEVNGGFILEASKPFANPAVMTAVIDEISGPDGPFQDFHLERQRQRFRDGWTFSGTVTLDATDGGLDTESLDQALAGIGVDVSTVQQNLGSQLGDAVTLRVRVAVPGNEHGNFTLEEGGGAMWEVPTGEVVDLDAHATSIDRGQVGEAALAAIAGLAAIWLAVRGITRFGQRRVGPGWDDTPFRVTSTRGETLPRFGYLRRSRRIR